MSWHERPREDGEVYRYELGLEAHSAESGIRPFPAVSVGAWKIARCLCINSHVHLARRNLFPASILSPFSDLQKIISGLRPSGIGVLITDHNVRETLTVTDRAYIIDDGRIFRHGKPEQLASDPEVRRVYLGESFFAGMRIK